MTVLHTHAHSLLHSFTHTQYTYAFWISTALIFLFEGVMPALTYNSAMSLEGLAHLGYPVYFGTLLMLFKVSGALALIIPQVSRRIKEWAYAGFGFNIISATFSNIAVDGMNGLFIASCIAFVVLAVSYISYHALHSQNA